MGVLDASTAEPIGQPVIEWSVARRTKIGERESDDALALVVRYVGGAP